MNRVIIAAAVIVAGSSSTVASASTARHSPYEKGAEPTTFAMTELRTVEAKHELTIDDPAGRVTDRILVRYDIETGQSAIEIVGADGRTRWRSESLAAGPLYATARTADFNADGAADFVISMPTGGCGIRACASWEHFILSRSDGSFRLTTTTSMNVRNKDFIDVNKDGRLEFIRTTLIDGGREICRDGKKHNFWVHELLTVEGDRLVDGSKLDRRFPVWIWYTYGENHQPTTMLTDEQKRRLWAKASGRQVSPPAAR